MWQKKTIAATLFIFGLGISAAQVRAQSVGIGVATPDSKSILELKSSTQGFLPPRVTTAIRTGTLQSGMGVGQAGLLVYDSSLNSYYYWNGSAWIQMSGGGASNAWALDGNTITSTNFIGTLNNDAIRIRTNNIERARFLADGRFIMNNAGAPQTFDLFSVYGNTSETAIVGYGGQGAPGIYGQGDLNGVLGISTDDEGVGSVGVGQDMDATWGVLGQSLRTSNGTGVVGTGNNIDPATTLTGGSGGAFTGQTVGAFGYAKGTSGFGMYGASNHAAGTGMVGIGNTLYLSVSPKTLAAGSGGAFTGATVGAFGFSNVSTGTSAGYGLYGASNHTAGAGVVGLGSNLFASGVIPAVPSNGAGGAFTGDHLGAYGHALSPSGMGVYGYAASTPSGTGVVGSGNNLSPTTLNDGGGGAFTGYNTGVFGVSTNTSGGGLSTSNGVYGQSEGNFDLSTGVFGLANGASATTYGVRGTSVSSGNGSAGVYGLATSTSFNSSYGVIGYTLSANTGSAGIFGVATDDLTGTGVVGVSNNGSPVTLATGSGVSGTGLTTGVMGTATASGGDRQGGLFQLTNFNVLVAANVAGTQYKVLGSAGVVSTAVPDDSGQRRIMYCPEAPEVLFEDYGSGKLTNGEAKIYLDPIFTKNIFIDENHPLRVFIQLEGDCKGVYVTNKSAQGFMVKELAGGQSNVSFMWHVVGIRADERAADGSLVSRYQDLRFPIAPDLNAQTVQNEKPKTPQDTIDYNARIQTSTVPTVQDASVLPSQVERPIQAAPSTRKRITRLP